MLPPPRTTLAPGVPVPITFACSCGKTLRVKDDQAGRWVRCPACKETAIVPEAAMNAEPQFEVVEDEPPPLPKRRDADDRKPFRFGDDGPAPRPRSRPDQEYDGERKASRRKRSQSKPDEKPGHFAMERGVTNAGVLGGLAVMVGAAVWFVVGLMNDVIFFYPPVLFILGMFAVIKGMVGGNND